jgi:hypothetical protein
VGRPFATLLSVAQARLRHAGRRLGVRLGLIAGCILAAAIFLGFALAAATAALTERVGQPQALAIMAGAALVVLLALIGILAIETRRERRIAARRASLDRQLLRAATISAPHAARLPGRAGIGLGLVALGALLVLSRPREADRKDRGGADDH